jgi:hypothetical protein
MFFFNKLINSNPFFRLKFRLLFFFAFLIPVYVYCQDDNNYEFIGMLKLSDSGIIPYKLTFKKNHETKIEGFSITDFYGSNKTKSKIEGFLSKKQNNITFTEIENISTISNANPKDFCYIHVKNASIKRKNGKTMMEGAFYGKFNNDRNCAKGTIYLVSTDVLDKIKKHDTALNKLNAVNLLNKTNQTFLTSDNHLNINWQSQQLIIELWDAATFDNDVITLTVDEKPILENYIIEHEKKIITLPFATDLCTIKIYAVSEGKNPPNTVNLLLKDNDVTHAIVTKLKKGESSTVIIKK